MTYCCGLMLEKGLVLMSDTRTNSGVDNISVFRKMFHFRVPGERSIALMTAGNLATTQAVISQLEERTKAPDERENALFGAETMFQVATEVGKLLRKTVAERQKANDREGTRSFSASIILAGQIAGMEQRLFLVYPEGNFIEASRETPFFQIGETKYGRPILLRGYDRDMSFERGQIAPRKFRFHYRCKSFCRNAVRLHGLGKRFFRRTAPPASLRRKRHLRPFAIGTVERVAAPSLQQPARLQFLRHGGLTASETRSSGYERQLFGCRHLISLLMGRE